MTLGDAAPHPDVLMVIWQVDREPWRTVASEGQMRTWLTAAPDGTLDRSGGRVLVRHALGLPGRNLAPRIDAWNSRLRWHRSAAVRRLNQSVEHVLGRATRRVRVRRRADLDWFGQTAWQFNVIDVHLLWRWKFIATLQAALEVDADFVFFTTSSSYIRPAALLDAIDAIGSSSGIYSGSIVQHRGFRFVSGACRLISRDVAQRCLDDAADLGNSRYEDIEFERWARRRGVNHQPLHGSRTLNVASPEDVDRLRDEEILGTAHFRCTTERTGGGRDDVRVMHRLHERATRLEASGG